MAFKLTKIVSTGENVSIEFKEKFTDTIGKTICAFSNTVGGKIYLGIADQKTNHEAKDRVVGIVRAEDDITRIEDMARSCDPAISVSCNEIHLDGTKRRVVRLTWTKASTSLTNIRVYSTNALAAEPLK